MYSINEILGFFLSGLCAVTFLCRSDLLLSKTNSNKVNSHNIGQIRCICHWEEIKSKMKKIGELNRGCGIGETSKF